MYQKLLSQSGFSMERLASFCAVADAGSIAGVAPQDPTRQSLISRQIRELEAFFGAELVRRKGRGLELTESGCELAAVGRENFKGLSDFAARCQGAPWNVRLVASNSVATWLLLPRLNAVAARMPQVRFEVHHEQTREIVTMTREGTYDVAFVHQGALDTGLKRTTLGEVGHSFLVPEVLLRKASASLGEVLARVPLALPVAGKMRSVVDALAVEAGVTPRVVVGCSSYLQAVPLVQSGMCAAALPDLAEASLGEARFHRLPLPYRYTLCLAWSARNADTRPALGRLIGELAEAGRIDS